jgi:hypothetical protein
MNEKQLVVPWLRIVLAAILYYLLLAVSIVLMLLYRMLYLPAAMQYVCGDEINASCFAHVIEQLALNTQWQAVQLLIYIGLSFILFPIFKSAKGRVLLNMGLVSVIVSSLLLLSIEKNGPELIAGALCPVFIGLLIRRGRKRKITFNEKQTNPSL